jgi:hypothetical protein
VPDSLIVMPTGAAANQVCCNPAPAEANLATHPQLALEIEPPKNTIRQPVCSLLGS